MEANDTDTIKKKRQYFVSREGREVLRQIEEKLHRADALKGTEDEISIEILRAEIIELLEAQIAQLNQTINAPAKSKNREVDRKVFPKAGEVLANTERIILKVFDGADKEDYLATVYEYSTLKFQFDEDDFQERMWNEALEDNTFMCVIKDRDGKYLGYCGIKDLTEDDWEIAIELKSEFCGNGYGTESIILLMKKMAEITEQRFFYAKVDIDNYASQAIMRKAGGYPDGLCEFLLHGNDIELFQKENMHLIDDKIREVAYEFCVDPEDLLGYVLRYRFDMKVA